MAPDALFAVVKPVSLKKFSFGCVYLQNYFANIKKGFIFVVLSKRE